MMSSMAGEKSQPSASPQPAQSAAPIASKKMKRPRRMPSAPASAVATDANPGTNFATISEPAPQRSKIDSVWRTQPSGESETRHNTRSTLRPKRWPAKYQALSAIRQAATAVPSSAATLNSPRAASAPVTSSTG